MSDLKIPRQFTNARIVYDYMLGCVTNGLESDITELKSVFGESIPRSTISQYISKFSIEYFDGSRFYTRSVNDRLLIGCHAGQKIDSFEAEKPSSSPLLDDL